MKKLVALAVAAVITSPLALADNTPSNVGNVTYLGNIVANSPMWQWTVNDYPGGRLDAKPSTATTANGTTTYPLNGQAFIAASGYLPSFVGINLPSGTGTTSTIGTRDITTLTDQKGAAPADVTDAQKGAVTFTIAASGYDSTGQAVEGKLKVKATELRSYRLAATNSYATAPTKGVKQTRIIAAGTPRLATAVGSCFIGTGSYSSITAMTSGTADTPLPGEQSATAFNALTTALGAADTKGTAPQFSTLVGYTLNTTVPDSLGCSTPTQTVGITLYGTLRTDYLSAAHVLELTPVELQFNTPLSGAWNSTLTVTAYTM